MDPDDMVSEINTNLADESIDEEDDDSDTDSEKSYAQSIDTIQVSKEFQENVQKYIRVDDLIREKQDETSVLRKEKKKYEDFVLKYLEQTNQDKVNVSDGKLIKNKTETRKPLTNEIIFNALSEKIKDPKTVQEILSSIDNKRPIIQNVTLKRMQKKKEKSAQNKKTTTVNKPKGPVKLIKHGKK